MGGNDAIGCRNRRCSRQMLYFVRLLEFSHTRRSESGGWESRCGNHDDQTRFEISGLSGSLEQTDIDRCQPQFVHYIGYGKVTCANTTL